MERMDCGAATRICVLVDGEDVGGWRIEGESQRLRW
jgi:hypothetical protein